MKLGQFRQSLAQTKRLLKKKGLLKGQQDRRAALSPAFQSVMMRDDYRLLYQVAVEMFDYDILFFDESIFQFSHQTDAAGRLILRYAFYQQPYDFVTYEEFVANNGFDLEEAGDLFRGEFEQALSEADLNTAAVAIRYDYAENAYKPGVHPVSHIHFGLGNQLRIPMHCWLTPSMFVLFVLRQAYPGIWAKLLEDVSVRTILARAKGGCRIIATAFVAAVDRHQLYLQ